VYARPFAARDDRPKVAVVMAGLGLSAAATEAAIKRLPPEVTLVFDPYGANLEQWLGLAREYGHEVLLSLPMEPASFPIDDPGPFALMTTVPPEENQKRLEFLLGRLGGYVGMAGRMGSRFTASDAHLRPVLTVLKARGLLYFDDQASADSLAPRIAGELGVPRVLNNVVLDAVPSRAAVDAKLAELDALARFSAAAVAVGHPYPSTIERVAAWAAGLQGRNLVLAPISALAITQTAK
jgi:polysaccharide deacetylase 2 family uncharacterized protein YibQ